MIVPYTEVLLNIDILSSKTKWQRYGKMFLCDLQKKKKKFKSVSFKT